jgi:hypothetical protein
MALELGSRHGLKKRLITKVWRSANRSRHTRILRRRVLRIVKDASFARKERNSLSNGNGASVKRSRRGGRRPQHSNNGGGGGGNNNGGGGGGYNPNRTFDSSGPEVKIRGAASHVYEKYLQLARDANSSGDRVMAENYLQHAEHYFRIMAAQQAQQAQFAAQQAAQNPGRAPEGQQPQPGTPQQGSGPSFSLTEGGSDEEEGEEAEAS